MSQDCHSEPSVFGAKMESRKNGGFRRLRACFEMPDSPERMLPMEGMRGFSVLLVFFVHFDTLFGSWMQPSTAIRTFFKFAGAFGHAGVDVFFVISGFLIYGITLKKTFGYRRFFLRRVRRIFPVFLTVLGVYLCLSLLFPGVSKIPRTSIRALVYIFANVAMLPGIFRIVPIITVAWSLSYEFLFYLTIPVIVGILKMRRWTTWGRTGFFLILTSGFSILYAHGFVQHHRLILFGAGIVLWELAHYTNLPAKLPAFGETAAVLGFAAILAIIGIYGMRTMDTQLVLPATRWWYSVGLFVTVFWLSLYAWQYNGYLKRSFSLSPLRWLGNMSYSYYLTHGLALHALKRLAPRILPAPPYSSIVLVCVLLIGMVFALAVSSALFLLVERPFSLVTNRPISAGARV
jgi:exopolysaccharide production protein ExoZ